MCAVVNLHDNGVVECCQGIGWWDFLMGTAPVNTQPAWYTLDNGNMANRWE
jgi:hypothetical protein